jgi:hypothetical protein
MPCSGVVVYVGMLSTLVCAHPTNILQMSSPFFSHEQKIDSLGRRNEFGQSLSKVNLCLRNASLKNQL